MGLDTVEFLHYAEKEFDITITDAEAGNVTTMSEFTKLCQQKLSFSIDEEQVFTRLTAILHQHFVDASLEIKREHAIVKDIGLN